MTCEFCAQTATTYATSGGESAWVCNTHYLDMSDNFAGDLRGFRRWK
ncbi:hypothetical protein [Nocardiopsis aegyptia]|uniref:Uncharacterized protein n=1 Tax=Nocardiopsis aegyptia TaxID=220378 RepID=A0A7Z0ESK7_9ACTN|nr:hypothetical protein [Nocardiopsis aegyptia]NYJ37492.1 hypothetical protein [Nocardiopsis aegyptia]